MVRPVTTDSEHEQSHSFQRDKALVTMLHDQVDPDLIDQWLTDCEIGISSTLYHWGWKDHMLSYSQNQDAIIPHRTVYYMHHMPGLHTDCKSSSAVNNLVEHAQTQGVQLKFMIMTADEQDLAWAYQRTIQLFGGVQAADGTWIHNRGSLEAFIATHNDKYREALQSPHTSQFDISPYLRGDVDYLMDQIRPRLIGDLENESLIRGRAQDFLARKRHLAQT